MKIKFNEELRGWDLYTENQEDRDLIKNCNFCLKELTRFKTASNNSLFFYNRKTNNAVCKDCVKDERIHKSLRARAKLKFNETLEFFNIVVVKKI